MKLGLMVSMALWLAAADGKSLENLLSKYVEQFNSTDEELYANAFPNSSAGRFLADYVPFFECPDADIERTYYFRWWTFRKHIRKVADGWVITEFSGDTPLKTHANNARQGMWYNFG